MKTINNLLWVLFAGVLLVSCGKADYRKTPGGMPYQLIKGSDTQQIKEGDFIKVHFTRKIKDSVYFTTEGGLPVYMQVAKIAQPYDISELWTSMKLGDSVIATQMLDTFIKRDPQSVPKDFKRGDKITYYLKVVGVFKSDSAARADYDNLNKQWLDGEIKTIEKYLADKKITAQKTPSGSFVEILNPGTGNLIDSGIYIPSVLAYAGSPGSPLIKPYENLIFEVEIVTVQDKAPVQPRVPGSSIQPVQQ